MLPLVGALTLMVVIHDGTVFYSRWNQRRDVERAQARRDAELARKTLEMLGGDGLRITNFYATPDVVKPGGPHPSVTASMARK
jgi:hypothetical protein